MSRVSRFQWDTAGKLQFVAATQSLNGISRFTHDPQSERFSIGLTGRYTSYPGFPTGNEFVFGVDDLQAPQAGFKSVRAESGIAFHPHSGALVGGSSRGASKWFKSDGTFIAGLGLVRNVLRGSASPDGRWMLLHPQSLALVDLNDPFRK